MSSRKLFVLKPDIFITQEDVNVGEATNDEIGEPWGWKYKEATEQDLLEAGYVSKKKCSEFEKANLSSGRVIERHEWIQKLKELRYWILKFNVHKCEKNYVVEQIDKELEKIIKEVEK